MKTPTSVYNLIAEYELIGDEKDSIIYGSIFLQLCRKTFPNLKINGFGRGDPRKTLLFKCCYKMVLETKSKIKPEEMDLYIYSQIAVLKANHSEESPVLVTPQILCGEKAQWRWKFFNKQSKIQLPQIQKQENEVNKEKIKKSIRESLDFLHKKIVPFTKENFYKKLEDGSIIRWYENKFICGYFVVGCEIIQEWIGNKPFVSSFGAGISIYQKDILLAKEILSEYKNVL